MSITSHTLASYVSLYAVELRGAYPLGTTSPYIEAIGTEIEGPYVRLKKSRPASCIQWLLDGGSLPFITVDGTELPVMGTSCCCAGFDATVGFEDVMLPTLDHPLCEWQPKGEIRLPPTDIGTQQLLVKIFSPYLTSITCGLHVHVSFKDSFCISLLMQKPFLTFWKEKREKLIGSGLIPDGRRGIKWAQETRHYPRCVEGRAVIGAERARYNLDRFINLRQEIVVRDCVASSPHSDRFINHSLGKPSQTVEFRLFGAWDCRDSTRNVQVLGALYDILTEWFDAHYKPELVVEYPEPAMRRKLPIL